MPKNQTSNTIVWAALLVRCEGNFLDLSDGEAEHKICAEQMTAAGILQKDEEDGCYILSSSGMSLLVTLEKLRDYSLGK